MRVHDLMPSFDRFVTAALRDGARGDALAALFREIFIAPHERLLAPLLEDFVSWAGPLEDLLAALDLTKARESIAWHARRGQPSRAQGIVGQVEAFFGRPLDADLALTAGLANLDGYARFDRGRHVVYIGADWPDPDDGYLDLITAHETGHVVREGDPATWRALSLAPDLTHDEFTERCPFEEHMVGEGLCTALSEVIYPGKAPREYLYYSQEEWAWCAAHEGEIREGLRAFHGSAERHYGLYAEGAIADGSPERTQYFWGYLCVRRLVERGRDLRELFRLPARELLAAADGL